MTAHTSTSDVGLKAKRAIRLRNQIYFHTLFFIAAFALYGVYLFTAVSISAARHELPFPAARINSYLWKVGGTVAACGAVMIVLSLVPRKTIRFFCPQCQRYLPSNLRWRCKRCKAENDGRAGRSFLEICKRCRAEPDAIACNVCGEVIPLQEGASPTAPAEIIPEPGEVVASPTVEKPKSEREQEREAHAHEEEQLHHKIKIAKLKKILDQVVGSENTEDVDPVEADVRKVKEKLRRRIHADMAVEDVLKEYRSLLEQRGYLGTELNKQVARLKGEILRQ